MSAEMSILSLISEASPVVKGVMLILVTGSFVSWAIIFGKWMQLRKARAAVDEFETRFWSGGNLGELHNQIAAQSGDKLGLDAVFVAGFKEFSKQKEQDKEHKLAGVGRKLRVALSGEMTRLEQHLSFLGTAGSIAPYIGLFGTVWGIMNSFIGLANMKQATLAVVAPGIAEALIATAMGLFVAIPAVMFYNKFVGEVDYLVSRYENFAEEFINIIQRGS